MKLKSLELGNFKGIKNFKMDADCHDLSILGANASGKTTIMDAVTWLLFDKDSLGRADFQIKTLDESGEPQHHLEHSVEAIFINGSEVKLKKVYQEKYTKKRGSTEKVFDRHETDHFIDDVPVKKGEFTAKVKELCGNDEKRFRLLTSPTAFANEKWQDQRNILINAFGDVTDEDVISSNPELAELPGILNGKTCDNYKKIVLAQRKEINEKLESIPARIDEAERSKPESLKVTNAQHCIDKLTKLNESLAAKQQEIADAKAGGGIADYQKRLATQDDIIRQISRQHQDNADAQFSGVKKEISAKKDQLEDLTRNFSSMKRDIASNQEMLKNLEEANANLRKQYADIVAEKFDGETCPTCKQSLPEDQIEEHRKSWNVTISNKKEKINQQGQANKAKIETLTADIQKIQADLSEKDKAAGKIEKELHELTEKLASFNESVPNLEELPEYQEALREKSAIEKEIESIRSGNTAKTEGMEQELATIQEQIKEQNNLLAAIESSHKQETRIAELKAEEKKLSAEFMRLEGHLSLIDTFTRTKVSMLDERISSQFEIVRFKLTKEQINGGVADCCEMTVNGVPYGSLNNAARIQGGLDIIRTLSRHYDFHPLVIVDNRESVTELPEMDTQVISLVVDPAYSELHVQ